MRRGLISLGVRCVSGSILSRSTDSGVTSSSTMTSWLCWWWRWGSSTAEPEVGSSASKMAAAASCSSGGDDESPTCWSQAMWKDGGRKAFRLFAATGCNPTAAAAATTLLAAAAALLLLVVQENRRQVWFPVPPPLCASVVRVDSAYGDSSITGGNRSRDAHATCATVARPYTDSLTLPTTPYVLMSSSLVLS